MKLIASLWKGEVGLCKVFWLYGILAAVLFNILFAVLVVFSAMLEAIPFMNIIIWVLTVVYFVYFIFIYIATWRSAGLYQGKKVWSVLARICVVLGFIGLALNLVTIAQQIKQNSAQETTVSQTHSESSSSSSSGHGLNQEPGSNPVLKEIDDLNKSLPKMVDEITELTNVTVKGHTIKYNYHIITVNSEDIDADKFNKNMRGSLEKKICSDPELKSIFNEGVQVTFSYKDKKDQDITAVTITAADCGY